MMTADGTERRARATVAALAAKDFAEHVIVPEGDGRWFCGKPGTGICSFRVVSAPGHLIVFGDIGDAILRVSDRDPIPWLRGAIRSPEYLASKMQGRQDAFWRGDAAAWLRGEIAEGRADAVKAAQRLAGCGLDAFERHDWYAAWDCSASDLPDFEGPSSRTWWVVEALGCFVRLLDAAAAAPGPSAAAAS
jgi:hypothetical protein